MISQVQCLMAPWCPQFYIRVRDNRQKMPEVVPVPVREPEGSRKIEEHASVGIAPDLPPGEGSISTFPNFD